MERKLVEQRDLGLLKAGLRKGKLIQMLLTRVVKPTTSLWISGHEGLLILVSEVVKR